MGVAVEKSFDDDLMEKCIGKTLSEYFPGVAMCFQFFVMTDRYPFYILHDQDVFRRQFPDHFRNFDFAVPFKLFTDLIGIIRFNRIIQFIQNCF